METSHNLLIARIITTAAKRRASDIHFSAGSKPVLRVDEGIMELGQEEVVTAEFIKKFIASIIDEYHKKILETEKNTSFVFVYENKVRIRVNLFYQKGTLAASLKLIPLKPPGLADLGLPKEVETFIEARSGLVVICGPYGSGKTTTAAAFIEEVNRRRSVNILTIEKPVEYIFFNAKSIVEQREVGRDTTSFIDALNYCREEDVDVLLVGETDERNVLPLLLEIASGGRLVFYIMNDITVAQAIEKILSQFGQDGRDRGRTLLAQTLRGVITQRLLPRIGGGKVLAAEVLIATPATRALIADDRIPQILSVLQTSQDEGMISLDQSLARLVKNGEAALTVALEHAVDPQNLKAMVK